MRELTVFFQVILTLGVIVTVMASGFLFLAHDGFSLELAKALGALAVCLGGLLAIERGTTGRWIRWPRR
ncbi:hypothetical protein OG458_41650 (plasmid) [Streptomyces sp. NBC_01281]|uniref:hypothetical protein n=1 Tax=Streptomyces sp. NBC_01281 TaxID=2903811 RepID=UPI002E13A182|nr:hypothetical protein OG458_41650 [Streptomyces sp. NBC_01281]